jgi:hypothetical protein
MPCKLAAPKKSKKQKKQNHSWKSKSGGAQMPRTIPLALRVIQRQRQHSRSCTPHASWSSSKDVESGVVLRLLARVGQRRVIPAGIP